MFVDGGRGEVERGGGCVYQDVKKVLRVLGVNLLIRHYE